MKCACAQTESLRGAAVNAYLARFLERVAAAAQPVGLYQCRICGTRWLREERDAGQPAQLVRLAEPATGQAEKEK